MSYDEITWVCYLWQLWRCVLGWNKWKPKLYEFFLLPFTSWRNQCWMLFKASLEIAKQTHIGVHFRTGQYLPAHVPFLCKDRQMGKRLLWKALKRLKDNPLKVPVMFSDVFVFCKFFFLFWNASFPNSTNVFQNENVSTRKKMQIIAPALWQRNGFSSLGVSENVICITGSASDCSSTVKEMTKRFHILKSSFNH